MFPAYLSIGMTYEQFWQGPPSLAVAFRRAEELRAKRTNVESWRMGMYIISAMNASVGNMLQEKGASPIKYFEQPLPLTQEDVDEQKRHEQEMLEERIKAAMMRWSAESQSDKKEGGDRG